jgi:sigma-B regulation protein RsbU (phosphoserine phosphatase)
MNDSDPPIMTMEFLSRPSYLGAIRVAVCTILDRSGMEASLANRISLAIDEALCNVINHGYEKDENGRISLSIWHDEADAVFRFQIEDDGRQVDPESIQPRDLDDIRPGGLGVHIIREVMDDTKYEQRSSGGMRLSMSVTALPEPRHEGDAPVRSTKQ